jgi:hypothetical protein
VRLLLNALIRDGSDAILVPIPQVSTACMPAHYLGVKSVTATAGCSRRKRPCLSTQAAFLPPAATCLQYPLYSASIQLYGGTLLPYHLKEEAGWSMDLNEITRSVHDARCAQHGAACLAQPGGGNVLR